MFKPLEFNTITISDQLLLRRIMDGSVSISYAKIIIQALSEGVYKDADEAIDKLCLLQLTNNRRSFEVLDELYLEKDEDLIGALNSPDPVHGVTSVLFGKVLRRSKGIASPSVVASYIEVLKEQHVCRSLG